MNITMRAESELGFLRGSLLQRVTAHGGALTSIYIYIYMYNAHMYLLRQPDHRQPVIEAARAPGTSYSGMKGLNETGIGQLYMLKDFFGHHIKLCM